MNTSALLLEQITALSHRFGTRHYVRGGGGNSSVKNETTLWVKPSGISLAHIQSHDFVAMNRTALNKLFEVQPPSDVTAQEALVKDLMQKAVLPSSSGRASVEAPLHNLLSARFVVHTHPAWVNGMTCAKNGQAACQQLFPDALWMDYVDPGYTLCVRLKQEIPKYRQRYNKEPSIIFLKNHGVFVAADQPQTVCDLYRHIEQTLVDYYKSKCLWRPLDVSALPMQAQIDAAQQTIKQVFGEPVFTAVGGFFKPAAGPVSPDHIVYAKSYYLLEKPTPHNVAEFEKKHGYKPIVAIFDQMVIGIGSSQKQADLALELAEDAAWVVQLADAFGGIDYMTDSARMFIENWEMESYRVKQIR